MTVYVDDRNAKKGNLVLSVMTADPSGTDTVTAREGTMPAELYRMVSKVRVPHFLFSAVDWPLYEVTGEMRHRALDAGAVAVPQYKLKRMMSAWLRGQGKDDSAPKTMVDVANLSDDDARRLGIEIEDEVDDGKADE